MLTIEWHGLPIPQLSIAPALLLGRQVLALRFVLHHTSQVLYSQLWCVVVANGRHLKSRRRPVSRYVKESHYRSHQAFSGFQQASIRTVSAQRTHVSVPQRTDGSTCPTLLIGGGILQHRCARRRTQYSTAEQPNPIRATQQ